MSNKRLLQIISKIALGSASLLATAYIILSPRVAHRLYANMLFHPWLHPEGDWQIDHIREIKCRDISFFAPDGTKLHAWYFALSGAEKTILLSHGNSGNLTIRKHLIDLLLESGLSVFIYDYRGYGLSEGKPSVPGIVSDGIAAYNYLLNEIQIPAENIILYGESLGAAVACQIASKCKSAGLILQSGFCSLARIGQEILPFIKYYPSILFPRPNLDSLSIIRKLDVPILVIHGVQDMVVPFSHAEEIFAQAKEPKKALFLKEAAHNDICSVAREEFLLSIEDFIKNLP